MPATPAARVSHVQAVHFLRFTVNFDEPGIATGVGKQSLPDGAIIIGTDVHVQTVFNAGTTNVLTVGTNAANFDNIIAAADVNEGATGLTKDVSPTGTALGPIAADVQVFAKYTQTGTAATTGRAQVIVKYVPNIDL